MQSIVLHAPKDLRLDERPIPAPGPGEVLVKIAYSAICHTDFQSIAGRQPGVRYPTVIGHEFAGWIERCGIGVKSLKPGDRVAGMGVSYCGTCSRCRQGHTIGCRKLLWIPGNIDGSHQEYMVAPEVMVYKISDSLRLEHAALVEPAANAWACVETAAIQPGDKVAVLGPGPIGLLAQQCAALFSPALLIVLGTRRERLHLARTLGATHTINVRETNPVNAVMDITGGDGCDAVLFCASNEDSWTLATQILGFRGRLALEATPPTYDTIWPLQPIKLNEKVWSLIGVNGYSAGQFDTALRLVEAGKIDVSRLITHRFPLNAFPEACETSDKRTGGAIKVVFEIAKENGSCSRS